LSGIYLHIPFCKQACTYCDFYFETSLKHRSDFVQRLIAEMKMIADQRPEFMAEPVETIYFGGGTPSQLTSEELDSILKNLRTYWNVSPDAEITIEMNPDDVQEEYLSEIIQAGVNRISMGVQTFNTERLVFMNRAHTSQEAHQALKLLQDSGCKSWTADLIYGNPGQTDQDLLHDLKQLLSYEPPHISAYSLTVEPNTRLGSMVRKKLVKPAEDDIVSRHMNIVTETLAAAGVERYEVSNFARRGHESRHNSAYWKHTNYIGLGPGAHSFWWDAYARGGTRWNNQSKLASYMKDGDQQTYRQHEPEKLTGTDLAEERLLIGLRTTEGVSVAGLNHCYGYSLNSSQKQWLQTLTEDGYIHPPANQAPDAPNHRITLTNRGLMIADYIALNLISRGNTTDG